VIEFASKGLRGCEGVEFGNQLYPPSGAYQLRWDQNVQRVEPPCCVTEVAAAGVMR
jgi:hypothetical protein